jgi:hypothetical protein
MVSWGLVAKKVDSYCYLECIVSPAFEVEAISSCILCLKELKVLVIISSFLGTRAYSLAELSLVSSG